MSNKPENPAKLMTVTHNTENLVTCAQAMQELGVSAYFLKAVRGTLGIRARRFMLSPVRDFLRDNFGAISTLLQTTGAAR